MLLASSSWYSLLTALLPFIILFVFWIFLTNRAKPVPQEDALTAKLEEIRQELARIRKTIESRP